MLLRYEFQKVFKNKTVLLCTCLFLLLNAFFAFQSAQKGKDVIFHENEHTEALVQSLDGTLTKEKVDFVSSEYERLASSVAAGTFSTEYDESTYSGYTYGDYNLFSLLKEELDRIYLYPQTLETAMQNLENNAEMYASVGNSYQARQSEKIRALYGAREITAFHDYSGLEAYFSYDISYLFVLLSVVVLLSGMFVQEKESGMASLLKTTAKGNRPVLYSKVCAGFLLTMLYAVLFFFEDFCVFTACFGSLHFDVPLYFLPEYAYTVFNGSAGAFALCLGLMKTLGVFCAAAVCMTISKWSKTYLKSVGASAIFLLALVFFAQLKNDFVLNPVFLARAQTMFSKPFYVGVFGLQLSLPVAVLLWHAVILFVFIGLLCFKLREKHARVFRRS